MPVGRTLGRSRPYCQGTNLPEPLGAATITAHRFSSPTTPTSATAAALLYAQMRDVEDGRLPRPRHQGLGPDALFPLRRRPAHPEGWRAARFLATEMLEALGVYTYSKSLSLVETAKALICATTSPPHPRERAGPALRHTHIRVGSFQRLLFLNEGAALEKLVAYCLETYHPQAPAYENPAVATPRRPSPEAGGEDWGAESGSRRASCTACSTPTTSRSPARASTTAPGAFLPELDTAHRRLFRPDRPLCLRRQPAALHWNPLPGWPIGLPPPSRPRRGLVAALRGSFGEVFDAHLSRLTSRPPRAGPRRRRRRRRAGLLLTAPLARHEASPSERAFFDLAGGADTRAPGREHLTPTPMPGPGLGRGDRGDPPPTRAPQPAGGTEALGAPVFSRAAAPQLTCVESTTVRRRFMEADSRAGDYLAGAFSAKIQRRWEDARGVWGGCWREWGRGLAHPHASGNRLRPLICIAGGASNQRLTLQLG